MTGTRRALILQPGISWASAIWQNNVKYKFPPLPQTYPRHFSQNFHRHRLTTPPLSLCCFTTATVCPATSPAALIRSSSRTFRQAPPSQPPHRTKSPLGPCSQRRSAPRQHHTLLLCGIASNCKTSLIAGTQLSPTH